MNNNFKNDSELTFRNLCDQYVSDIPSEEDYQLAVDTLKSTYLTRNGKTIPEIKTNLSSDVKQACWTVVMYNIRYLIDFTGKNIAAEHRTDFMNEAVIFSVDAALKYDFVSAKFTTYANNYLTKCKTSFISGCKNGPTESIKYTEITNKIWKVFEQYKEETGMEPTASEIASIMSMKTDTVMEHLEHMRSRYASSIFTEVETKDGVSSLSELIRDTSDYNNPVAMAEDIETKFQNYYESLPMAYRTCYEMSMGIGTKSRPNTKISNELGISVDEVKANTNHMKSMINEFFNGYGVQVDYGTKEFIS